jgi:hypothetical protein
MTTPIIERYVQSMGARSLLHRQETLVLSDSEFLMIRFRRQRFMNARTV